MQTDSLDVQSRDLEQLQEIELISELMIACAGSSDARLAQDVIDEVLHIGAKPS